MCDPMLLVELGVIFALILLNAVFAGAEIAIVAVRQVRLQQRAAEGNRRARAALELRTHPERFFATVQVGISVVGATAAAFGGATFAEDLEPVLRRWDVLADHAEGASIAIVIALVSYLSIVVGELAPKSLALKYAESYALLVSRPLLALSWAAKPVIWFLTRSSNVLLSPFGDKTSFSESRLSAEELQELVVEARKQGTVNEQIGEIASRALELEGLTAKDVMIPRERIHALSIDASMDELQRVVLESGHQRVPVYRGRLDNIVGYLMVKDLLAITWERQLIVLQDVVRPAFFVHENMLARRVLSEFQRHHTQLAIVVDEHGGLLGLITLEDILEELVGELFDEDDSPEESIVREGLSAVIRGHVPIREVNRALQVELPDGEGFSTIAGLCLHLAGGVPVHGARFVVEGVAELEVVEASPRAVRLVRVTPARPRRSEGQEPSAASDTSST